MDYGKLKRAFLLELLIAAAGNPSSLSFIKHTLPEHALVVDGQRFQVIVIGGTVFRKAQLKKEGGSLIIEQSEESAQPPFLNKDAFLEFIKGQINPNIQVIGLNFAYPLSPVFLNNKLDGVLISGSKENSFSGMINERIGEMVEQLASRERNQKVTVSAANDAICLLLSGLTSYPKENLVAAIMGTGTNITFFHDGYAINLESANFDKFTQSDECAAIDAVSGKPGRALFEKETSGGYIYQHFNLLLKKYHYGHAPINSSKELAQIAIEKKVPILSELAQSLIQRSAAYFAAQLAAVAEFKQQPINVIMEGSFFWKNELFKQQFETSTKDLSPEFPITVAHIDNSPVIGGAKLVA